MKLKIISGNNYLELEPKVNEFMSIVKVLQVEVKEVYDIQSDNGFVTYHIFYEEPSRKFTPRQGPRP